MLLHITISLADNLYLNIPPFATFVEKHCKEKKEKPLRGVKQIPVSNIVHPDFVIDMPY